MLHLLSEISKIGPGLKKNRRNLSCGVKCVKFSITLCIPIINALGMCKIIDCGRLVVDNKFIFALGERAYSTLSYPEIITVVSHHES